MIRNGRHQGKKRLLAVLTAVLLLTCLFAPPFAAAAGTEGLLFPDGAADADSAVGAEVTEDEEISGKEGSADGEKGRAEERNEDIAEDSMKETAEETPETTAADEAAAEKAAEGSNGRTAETAPAAAVALPALYADAREDVNYIIAEKRFVGLTEAQIPASFTLTVSSDAETYTLDAGSTVSRFTQSDGTAVWRWRLAGVGTGSYRVSESGEAVEGYTVQKSGGGTVEVKAAELAVAVPVHETTCSHTDWPVRTEGDKNFLFAATLTQGGVAVISEQPLSASQRAAVAAAVLKINGPWKNPVYFYSAAEQIQTGTGFELNGATVTYDAATQRIVIGRTRNWQHVATLSYSVSAADVPEIVLVNTYTRAVTDVTVSKTVTGGLGDREKRFDFTVSVTVDGTDADFELGGSRCTGSARFSLRDGESVTLHGVPLGAAVTVTEDDYGTEGYTTCCAVDGMQTAGRTAVLRAAAGGSAIRFTNGKDIVPDTGVSLDRLPYVLLTATAGAAALLLRRSRRR